MSDLFLSSEDQMVRISPNFALSHGVVHIDDLRVFSSIVCIIKNILQWKDASVGYGWHKTLYNCFIPEQVGGI